MLGINSNLTLNRNEHRREGASVSRDHLAQLGNDYII